MRSSFHSSPEKIDLLVYTAPGEIRFNGFSQSKEGAVIVCSEINKNADPRRQFGSNVNVIHSYAPNSVELGGLTDLKNELQIDGSPIGIDFLQPPYPGYDAAQSPLPLSNGVPRKTLSNRYGNNQSLHLRAPQLAQPTSGRQDKIMSGQLTTVRRRSFRVRFATSERSQLLICSCSGRRQ